MFIYSGVALYVVSLINKGFVLPSNLNIFFQTVLMIAFAYYLILPISKLIFLPLNIFSFGLVSFAVFVLFIYIMSNHLGLIEIKDWVFAGGSYFGITLNKISFNYTGNLILSSLLISIIIKVLETLT
jgi:uncharacterized membrane protein YvlD (DUF360 family)